MKNPIRPLLGAAVLALLLPGAARADRYYRLVREGRTIGFYQVADEKVERFEGREARARQTRLAVLATYVGSSELHAVRETTWFAAGDGALLGYRVEYRQGRDAESRLAVFAAGRAVLQILNAGRAPEERSVEVPAGAFVHTGWLGLAELAATDERIGEAFTVLDPKSLDSRVGVLEPAREETIEVRGHPMVCRLVRFRHGDATVSIWLAAGNRELVRLREEGTAGIEIELADERVVAEVEGLDVSAPPLERRREFPWEMDREYQYDFLVGGKVAGWIRFTPTLLTIEGRQRIAIVSKIDLASVDRRWTSSSATHYDAETLAPIYFEFDGAETRADRIIDSSLKVTFRDGQVGVVFQKDKQILENRQAVPPGCQIVHNNNVEQFAVFLSQIDLDRGQVTRVNAYHPRLFKGFLISVEAGATRTVGERPLTEARLSSDLFQAEILLDASGRVLSYGHEDWEFRLVE